MAIRNSGRRKFVPTQEQLAIFKTLKNEGGNVLVEALAGTGKTTTQEEAVKRLKMSNCGVMAFNKSIATELQKRMPKGVWAGTMHSRGYGEVAKHCGKRPRFDKYKYRNLVREEWAVIGHRPEVAETSKLIGLIRDVHPRILDVSKEKASEWIREVEEKFGLKPFGDHEKVLRVMEVGKRMGLEEGFIDFGDMIWCPLVANLCARRFALLMVDEAQDLNPAQIEFVLARGKRLCPVGDRFQSLYGFRGADPYAIDRLTEAIEPQVLPLTETMRCPKGIVELVNGLVPLLRPRKDAAMGTITEGVEEGELPQRIGGGDLILSRVNAPLAKLLFRFWKMGISAKILGRDYHDLVMGVWDRCGNCSTIEELRKAVELMQEAEMERASRMRVTLIDTCDTLLEIIDQCDSLGELRRVINDMFVETTDEKTVRLSTIHRAKGLEAYKVVMLNPELLPHPMAEMDWEYQQELNLAYVAATRVKGDGELLVVGNLPTCLTRR